MVGFILACLGHRYRAVAGSNPALPTNLCSEKRFSGYILKDGHLEIFNIMNGMLRK
jgi:hypothetical protein